MNFRAKTLSCSVIMGIGPCAREPLGPRNAGLCVRSRGLGAREEKKGEGEKGNANSLKQFGIPGTIQLIHSDPGFSFQRSCKFTPPSPIIGNRGINEQLNLVAQMIASSSMSSPLSNLIPWD